jgi:hypothetical protein
MFLIHFCDKLLSALSSVQGALTAAGLVILNCIVPHKVVITFVVVVVVLDLIWGIAASIKKGQFTTSELGRDTISKFAVYGTAILTFCFLDRILGENFTLSTAVISAIIMLVELWSSFANALICFPRMPFLRLMLPVLEGEIANKLHTSPEEVRRIFNASKSKKK